jgi:hypothetical protein
LPEDVNEPVPIELLHLDRTGEDLLHMVCEGNQMVGAVHCRKVERRN